MNKNTKSVQVNVRLTPKEVAKLETINPNRSEAIRTLIKDHAANNPGPTSSDR